MSNNSKRIAIARAIMYKELAKRNAERERECKRRGLWTLWHAQTEYKTLWHFLRANDKRLIEVCYDTINYLNQLIADFVMIREKLIRANQKNPNAKTYDQIELVMERIARHNRTVSQIDELVNKLTGGNHNENQN